jgi:hypothetical protein
VKHDGAARLRRLPADRLSDAVQNDAQGLVSHQRFQNRIPDRLPGMLRLQFSRALDDRVLKTPLTVQLLEVSDANERQYRKHNETAERRRTIQQYNPHVNLSAFGG